LFLFPRGPWWSSLVTLSRKVRAGAQLLTRAEEHRPGDLERYTEALRRAGLRGSRLPLVPDTRSLGIAPHGVFVFEILASGCEANFVDLGR
jgi:hypothetical protein